MPDSELTRSLRRTIRQQAYAIVALAVAIVAGGAYFYVSLSHETSRTRSALCTFRGDLEQRVNSSQDFLDEHPGGILGIPAASIRTTIANQRATIASLAGLRCPAPPKKGTQ